MENGVSVTGVKATGLDVKLSKENIETKKVTAKILTVTPIKMPHRYCYMDESKSQIV